MLYIVNSQQGALAVEPKDLPRSNYALHLADTVLVGEDVDSSPTNLTARAPTAWERIAYQLQVGSRAQLEVCRSELGC